MCFWRSFFLTATVILYSSPFQSLHSIRVTGAQHLSCCSPLQTSTACEDRLIMRIHCYTHWYTHCTHGVSLNMFYFMFAHPISSSCVHDWVSPFCRRAAPVLVVFFSCPHYSRPTLRLRSYTTVSDRLFDESNKPSVDALRTMRNTVSCASLQELAAHRQRIQARASLASLSPFSLCQTYYLRDLVCRGKDTTSWYHLILLDTALQLIGIKSQWMQMEW